MSSQRGNVSRSRPQKHQNATVFRNNKYGATVQLKKANAKVHEGVCQRCKDVLEWKIKFNKYKALDQSKKCVKCLQKTVRDAYYIMCKPCALKLDLCAKCGKKEEIVIPLNTEPKVGEDNSEESGQKGSHRKRKDDYEEDFDFDSDPDDSDSDLEDKPDVNEKLTESPKPNKRTGESKQEERVSETRNGEHPDISSVKILNPTKQ